MVEERQESEDSNDLITWINTELKNAKAHYQDWRNKAQECYDFVASEQWDEDDKTKMQEKGRIPIVFNRIARVINVVSGMEVQNRQEVRYIPRELGDAGVNEVLTSAAKWVRDNCDAEDEESEAFQDTLICGEGWTETWMDYESDPEGLVRIDRIDPLEILSDHQAKKRNKDDSRWVARFKKLPTTEFREMWPDANPTKPVVDLESEDEKPHDATGPFYEKESAKHDDKFVTVVQFQWWEREVYYQVQIGPQVQELDENKFKMLSEKAGKRGIKLQSVKRTRKKYQQAFISGSEILEQGEAPCKKNFSFRCITGLRNRNDNTWFGIVELMKDPQRWANKWLSQIMYIISVNAKGGLLAEKTAFENVAKAENTWASADSITWLNPGGLEKVREKGQAEYPEGLDRLLQYALQSINDVPGVNLELMGMANRDQAGVLEAQRKQAGVTILAVFFDALRRYRKEQGRVLMYFIQEYVSDGRLIKVLGKNGQEQYIPLVRDPNAAVYDVVVDDAPTSPNMKEKVFATLSQLVPQLLQAGIPIPPEILDYTPLPEALTKKWKEQLNQPKPNPEMEKAKQEMELKQKTAEVDAQIEQGKIVSKAQLEMQKLQMEMELKREQMLQEIDMKRQQMAAELEIKREAGLTEIRSRAALEDARMQKVTDTLHGSISQQGDVVKEQTGQLTTAFSELLREIREGRNETKQLLTAPRELVRDDKGRAKGSRVVLQ